MNSKITQQTVNLFNKYAHGYATKYMSVEKYSDSLDLFCASLPVSNANVLELACGPGNITKYILEQNPDLTLLATDLSPVMLELAEENNPSISTQIMDCRSIQSLKSKFDGVICGFGLPYISKEDAVKLIIDASNSLNPGGILYLSTMEGNYSDSGLQYSGPDPNDGLYMYFHEFHYLDEAMKQAGFEIIDISRVRYKDEKQKDVTDLILIGKKYTQ